MTRRRKAPKRKEWRGDGAGVSHATSRKVRPKVARRDRAAQQRLDKALGGKS